MIRTLPKQTRLPSPYLNDWLWRQASSFFVPGAMASGVWPTANLAAYVPVVFPVSVTLYELRFRPTNATGNYDLGFYDENFNRVASTGSQAMSSAIKTLTLPEFRARAGVPYYAALALSSSSGALHRWTYTTARELGVLLLAEEAAALPLPATATPVTPATFLIVPVFAFGVR